MLPPMDPTVNSTEASAGADYRKKRIKNVQKLELVRLMKANFLFIRGKHAVARSEKSRADVWKVITARLNSFGPPVQSAEAWQRRWNDMRSATKSKMMKIQSYVREHGQECPYKLNLVERLIWETFSVRPEEYMKDLNMKLWREKQQLECGRFGQQAAQNVGTSSEAAKVSPDQGFNTGWATGVYESGGPWQSSASFTSSGPEMEGTSTGGSVMDDSDRTRDVFSAENSIQPDQDFSTHPPADVGYGTYSAGCSRNVDTAYPWPVPVTSHGEREDGGHAQAKMATSSSDLAPGSLVLRELNKLFDLVLRQNEEILYLLRRPNEH